jgi:glycosyltransferase involved in cell wall biosynthesis
MNLFVIPSWYPSRSEPIGGIFTKEQAEAIAELCPDINVILSTWGHFDAEIPLRRPWYFIKVLLWRVRQNSSRMIQRKGVWEIFNPVIYWSHLLPFGGAHRLIEVNRRNLKLAVARFGKIDVIHAHVSYPAGYVASLLAKEFGIAYVVTEHMSPFPFSSLMRKGIPLPEIATAFDQATITIAVSPSLAKRIASFGYGEPTVIPNVVDERRFLTGEPVPGKFVFFTLCGLTDQKGIDHLLEAIALWNPPADQFEFRIGGNGPMRRAYQDLAERLGVADRVCWLGAVTREDAPRLFRECHVYVMPSRHETFGVVYAEAIASGKPIIATRCGGPEFIVNENNGMLVDVGDVRGLVKAMELIATRWDSYKPDVIRADFEKRFSRTAVVTKLTMLYQSAMDKG